MAGTAKDNTSRLLPELNKLFSPTCVSRQHTQSSCKAMCGTGSCLAHAGWSPWQISSPNLMGEFTCIFRLAQLRFKVAQRPIHGWEWLHSWSLSNGPKNSEMFSIFHLRGSRVEMTPQTVGLGTTLIFKNTHQTLFCLWGGCLCVLCVVCFPLKTMNESEAWHETKQEFWGMRRHYLCFGLSRIYCLQLLFKCDIFKTIFDIFFLNQEASIMDGWILFS